jgi:hypothetical protein
MVTVNIERGAGLGTYKMAAGSASLSNGDTITTKFSNIESVQLTAESTSGNYVIVNFAVSGNTVTVYLAGAASGTAPSTLTSAVTVHYQIIGY